MPAAKKKTGKKVSIGGGGLNAKKSRLNLKLVIPIVLVIAALGGFYIFKKSSAASSGALYGEAEMVKNDGASYRIGGRGSVGIKGYANFPNGSKSVCAMVRPIAEGRGINNVPITISASWKDGLGRKVGSNNKTQYMPLNKRSEICVSKPASTMVSGTSGQSYAASVTSDGRPFGVNSIYPR